MVRPQGFSIRKWEGCDVEGSANWNAKPSDRLAQSEDHRSAEREVAAREVSPVILGWGVPPGSPNPDENALRIRILLFLSYSFGIETTNLFIHSRDFLKNHTRFQTKCEKCIPVFRLKRRKNPTLWGGTWLI